jgi:hypothetical protein
MRGWILGETRKKGGNLPNEERTIQLENGERVRVVGKDLSYNDVAFMHKANIPLLSRRIEWRTQQDATNHPRE